MSASLPSIPPIGPERRVLITGFAGALGRRLARQLIEDGPIAKLYLLVPKKLLPAATQAAAELPRRRGTEVEVLTGDVLDLHFGVQGSVFRAMASEVTEIFHLAEVSHPAAAEAQVSRVNVEGTRNVLELAAELPRLSRLHHLSTVLISGDREGIFSEDDRDAGQQVVEPFAASKLEAERLLVRQWKRLPITCYRTAFLVGDSETGETDRLEGPFYLAARLALSALTALPVAATADQPMNVVPVDHVARAFSALSRDARSVGRTLHLVDPNPMSVRKVYEAVAALRHKRVQLLPVSRGATDAVLKMPFVERLWHPQRRGFGLANQLVFYTQEEAARLLPPSCHCPPLRGYLSQLLEGAQAFLVRRKERALPEMQDDVPEG